MKAYKMTAILAIGMLLTGLAELPAELWENFTTGNSDLHSNSITALAVDRDEEVWVGTNSGLGRYRNGSWTLYNTANSDLPSDIIHDIAIHPETNHIWIGTNNGLARFTRQSWTIYDRNNTDMTHNVVRAVAIDEFNTIWAGTLVGGLARFAGHNWTIYRTGNSDLPHNNVRALAVTKENEVWIGTDSGLASFRAGEWEVYRTDNSGLWDDHITSIATYDKENVVVGTRTGGILIIDERGMTFLRAGNSNLPSGMISSVAAKDGGVIWIGTTYSGLVKLNRYMITVYEIDNSDIIDDEITAVTIAPNRYKWIGTESGISLFKSLSVTEVKVTPDNLVLREEDSQQLTAEILPADATDKSYTWSSSDSLIASVDDNGYVTAHETGNVTISAVSNDGRRTGRCSLIVAGEVAKPSFDPPAGDYDEVLYVTISTETPNADIYYTIDGSEPTEESKKYEQPIRVDSSLEIKARAYLEHWDKSEIAAAKYDIVTAIADDAEEIAHSMDSSVYPNPVTLSTGSEKLRISFNSAAGKKAKMKVYDIRGRIIRKETIASPTAGENVFSFITKDESGEPMAQGVYFYSIRQGDTAVTGKFSVIR